jgi:hypothetical protein
MTPTSGSGSRILASKSKAKTLEKVLKKAHILYILACRLQIDADPDSAYHFGADPDPDFYLMRIRMRIRILIFI